MHIDHPGCAGFEQRGNQTGHCSNCHQTFSSLRAFDAHQIVLPDRAFEASGVLCTQADQSDLFVLVRADGGVNYWGLASSQRGEESRWVQGVVSPE